MEKERDVSNPVEMIERGFINLLIAMDYAITNNNPSRIIFDDEYVVVGWTGNPAIATDMFRDTYLELGHVTARFGRARVSAFED